MNKLRTGITYKRKELEDLGIKWNTRPGHKEKILNSLGRWETVDTKGNISEKGRLVRFTEIFEEQQEIEDLRKNNGQNENSHKNGAGNNQLSWTKEGQYLLIENLINNYKQGISTLTQSTSTWLNQINVVNGNYSLIRNNLKEMAKIQAHLLSEYDITVPSQEIRDFLSETHTKRRNNLLSILESLQKNNIINYCLGIRYKTYKRDSKGNKILNINGEYETSTYMSESKSEFVKMIQATERYYMDQLGYDNKYKLLKSSDVGIFYKLVYAHLEKTHNISNYYQAITISLVDNLELFGTVENNIASIRKYQDKLRTVRIKNKETNKFEEVEIISYKDARELINKKAIEQLQSKKDDFESINDFNENQRKNCMIDFVTNENAKTIKF